MSFLDLNGLKYFYNKYIKKLFNSIGDLTTLKTTEKTNIVGAVNELNEELDYLYVSNRTFESIVPLARQNGLTVFHGQNISGITGLDEDNDVVIEIYRYPGDVYTHKVIVYDFRSEKILTISCLNNYWFGWKSFNFTDIS